MPSKQQIKILSAILLLGTFGLLLLAPNTQYKMGNIFFGDVGRMYNLQLAQYLFTYAAYPILGTPPMFAHHQLSRTYFIEGDLQTALAEAEKELVLYPENKRTYYILGLTLGYMNREEEAIEAFSKFIEVYPQSWAARNDKAWLQFRIGDVQGALETIHPIKDIRNPWIQNTYGTLLLNDNKYLEAEAAFSLAKSIVDNMTEEGWGDAYPGNDPRIYAAGLSGMKKSIDQNIELTRTKL